MRLLGNTKKDFDKYKNEGIAPKLESVKVVLIHCNLVKNDYQHSPKVSFIFFVSNKQFGQLIQNFLMLKFGLQIKLVKHSKLKII